MLELAELSFECVLISAKWVIAWKTNQAAEIVWEEARLVSKGFEQKEGIEEIFL